MEAHRIIVGMSGGVDSSVAALLLARAGHDVAGVFMKNWEEPDTDGPCQAAIDANDAYAACERIGIGLDAVNFAGRYLERVFAIFLAEYRAGRTPNPDILCNSEIKFRTFLDHALAAGADHIATGHYARVERRDGRFRLLKGRDPAKDQSYFLHALTQEQLSRALFPLGDLRKDEVRRIAREAGLPNHARKDSTGICFIGERRFREFLQRYLPAQPGPICTADGECVGRHEGLMYYTPGQRKGLGIGGRAGGSAPWYVTGKDLEGNRLLVARGHDDPNLYAPGLIAGPIHWIAGPPAAWPLRCVAKIRYRQDDQACLVEPYDDTNLLVTFEQPQRAIAPGQSVVFYDGDECLGGGVIESPAPQQSGTRLPTVNGCVPVTAGGVR
jgi:tRNA-uridine 2-sulfurtransferase